LSSLFTSQWGKLVEWLVEGDLVKLLNEHGIAVEQTLQRVKGNKDGQNYEFDIIAVNGHEMVIVEVKTTLRVEDVNDFHEKLWKAKRYLPDYSNKKNIRWCGIYYRRWSQRPHGRKTGILRNQGYRQLFIHHQSKRF